MPSILVTRKLPSSVLSKLHAIGTVDLYTGDGAIPAGELRARVADKDALVCLLTDADRPDGHRRRAESEGDRQRRRRLQQRRRRLRAIARDRRHEHAGRAHRVGRRFHLGAHPRDHPAAVRGRAAGAPRRVEGLGARSPARIGAARQTTGSGRHGTHRTRRGGARARVRDARGVRIATRRDRSACCRRWRRRAHVARQAADWVRHHLAPRAADARDQTSHRQAGADAHEAVRVSHQHRARPGRRRGRRSRGPCSTTCWPGRLSTSTKTSRPFIRICCASRTCCSCRTSAAERPKRARRWPRSRSTTCWPCWPASPPLTPVV